MDDFFEKLSLRRHRSTFRRGKRQGEHWDEVYGHGISTNNLRSTPAGASTLALRPTERGSSSLHTPEAVTEADLCKTCGLLIDTVIEIPLESAHSSRLLKWGYSEGERRIRCQLCQFLGKYFAHEGTAVTGGYLREQSIYSLNPGYAEHRSSKSTGLLTLGTRKFGVRKRRRYAKIGNDIEPRRIKRDVISYNIIREWMEFCEKHHEDTCQPVPGALVQGFKVIDCRTKCVVQPEVNCKFAALSYVWGVAHAPERSDNIFPRTIEDSILVTLQLGIHYLWVDKYCIDQSDSGEKHTQIRSMDIIYSMANLVIIAAAGEDPSYGLPGVGSRIRQPQAHLSLNHAELFEIHSGLSDLRASLWASRAWTLQEAYLSNRRLIFTDKEVLYLCNHMYCQESVKQELHHRRPGNWDGLDGSHLFGAIPILHHTDFNTDQILTEYTKRNLSFDSDALNACLGILKAMRPLHWYGMPIELSAHSGLFTLDLQWHNHRQGFRQEKGIMRPDFPTWSWTSIRSEKAFPKHRGAKAELCTFSAPTRDGQWITVDEWITAGADQDLLGPFTRLRAVGPVVRPEFKPATWPHEHYPGYDPWAICHLERDVLDIRPSIVLALRVILDETSDDPMTFLSDAVGLFIQSGNRYDSETISHTSQDAVRLYPVILILKPYGDCYKRVGITNWNNAEYINWPVTGYNFASAGGGETLLGELLRNKETLYLE